MNRRKFIKSGITIGGSILCSAPLFPLCSNVSENEYSRIIIARDNGIRDTHNLIDGDRMLRLLDSGIQSLYDVDTAAEGWTKIVSPGEVIGLKVNCLSGRGVTHPDLVDAVAERLQQSGIKKADIIIWDRFSSDLEECGYRITYKGNSRQCMGNDILGFENDFYQYGAAASLLCKTVTRVCDGIINLPVLKDHGIAGITCAMKNFFGAIHNPNKYHLNVGNPYIADVYSFSPIKNKVRVHICDALNPQYEGGPSFMPQWSWNYNALILSRDPVAMDYTAWQLIEEQRIKNGFKSLKDVGRAPSYIATAADKSHRLGINDPARIKQIAI